MPNLFTFYWNDVHARWSNENLHSQHILFNEGFTQIFPKLAYIVPFSTYNDAGFGIGSQLSGTAETNYDDPEVIKAGLAALADGVDIVGDPSKLHVQVVTPDSGDNLQPAPNTVNDLVTTDGVKKALNDLGLPVDNPFQLFGLSTGMLIAIAAGVIYIATKK